MPTDWNKIADDAAKETDVQLENKISRLASLSDEQITKTITDSGISKENLGEVLKIVRDATKSNVAKANAIKNISNGIDIIVGVASKFI